MLFAALAGAYVFWRGENRARDAFSFGASWLLLYAPFLVFRVLYYGDLLPNTYYAKSGSLAYWSQGGWYLLSYFQVYFVLIAGIPSIALIVRDLRRPGDPHESTRCNVVSHPLVFAWCAAVAGTLVVTRFGGDYMFARFFIPLTPFLLILIEYLVQRLKQPWRRLATIGVLLAILVAPALKNIHFSERRHWHDIADEPQVHSTERFERIRRRADALRACLAGTDAKVFLLGGQATLAYYAEFPTAIEAYGLTDKYIAHLPVESRSRPGHEKFPDAAYVCNQRKVNFYLHYGKVRAGGAYSQIQIPEPDGMIFGQILVYDRELMDHLKTSCPGVRFFNFPMWLERIYIPRIPQKTPADLLTEYRRFQDFYFNHNPDPEGLLPRLRSALEARGVTSFDI